MAGKHLISKNASLAYRCQQEVVWQKVQAPRPYMILHFVQALGAA